MERIDKHKNNLSRDDILEQIVALEKESGQKLDDGAQETIIRGVNGVIGFDQVALELKLRAAYSKYIINRTSSVSLMECLSCLSVSALREMLDFIIHVVEEALPPDEYITAVSGTEKKLIDIHNNIFRAKGSYTDDLKSRKKNDLAADAYRLLSNSSVSKRLMFGMGPESRNAYDKAINDSSNYSLYAITTGLIYVFGGKKSDGYSPLTYTVPDELKDIWLTLTENEIKRNDTAALYASAAANLYGVIPANEVYNLIRRYDTADDKDSISVSLAAMSSTEILMSINLRTFDDDCRFHLRSDFNSSELYVISEKYCNYMIDRYPNYNECRDTFGIYKMIKDKPRYFPSKSKFLKYADPDYYERTPEINALRLYIQNKYGKQFAKYLKYFNKEYMEGFKPFTQDEGLDNIIDDLHTLFVSEDNILQNIIDVLEKRDITFCGTAEIDELLVYINAARNNTRTWDNKGYSSESLSKKKDFNLNKVDIYNPVEDGIATVLPMPDVGTIDKDISVKTDENDLCPCGSGKKFKKCCGK